MDDHANGRLFREPRIRLGWPQRDVALKAGISRASYSEMEHGRLGRVPLDKLRKVASVLEVRLRLEPSWRGAAIDIVTSSRHAAMAERVARLLTDAGWLVQPEVSFNHFGERGVVDIVAWHAATQTLLLVEVKTELADVNDLLAVTNRRRRVADTIAQPFGWRPRTVAQWVAVAASRTNERRAAAHRSLLRSAFPSDGRSVSGFLHEPREPLSALSFLPDSDASSVRRRSSPTLRVRPHRSSTKASTEAA
jgi:transcriptional regulator with XRE-family HTH domain